MKKSLVTRHSSLVTPLAALCIVHCALCIAAAAEGASAAPPPAAAAQEGVRLWEGGPFWADRNVGAEEPWEPGLYFWWGDAVGCRRAGDAWVASDGSTTNFSFQHGGEAPYGKTADRLRSEGWTTEVGVLAPEHDSARAHWGGQWRMPTRQELLDIGYNKCDWIPTTTNGVKGYVVRGRGDYANAAIFLPIDGWGDFTRLDRWEKYGHLWASDPRTDLPTSWRLRYGTQHNAVFYHFDRYVGTTVRPVRGGAARSFGQGTSAGRERREGETRIAGPACAPEEILAPASAGEPAAQAGVRLWEGGPLWADRNIGAETPSDYGWFFSWANVVGCTHDSERRRWPAVDGSDPNHCCDESPRNSPGFGMDPDALRLDGVVTESGALAPERDAARAHWGAAWRMPTRQDLDGLREKCDWTWTTNGVKGCVVRGRGDYASAAIFLPAAGFGIEEKWWNKGETGLLWSSEPYAEGPPTDGSWRLHFSARGVGVNNCWDRYIAVPVRPVRDAAAAEPPRTPKALVIMLDGLRADAVENVAGAANLRMLRDGAWRPEYGCAWSLTANTILDAPTMSGPNHVSIACGVTAAKHRVLRNQKNTCDHGKWPSWLVRLADARPEAKTLFAFAWDWDQDLSPDPRVEFVYGKDDENARTAAGRLADPDGPDAVQWFIDRIDHAGHLSGFYPYAERYTNEVARADRTIGRALDAIASRPTFADEDWLIVVTADHGGYHKNHGQMNGPATTIPLLVVGRDVARGRMAGTPHDYDIAPTVLAHFGVDASGMDLDGRVVGKDPPAVDPARPLKDGLAAYLPFEGVLEGSEKLGFENGGDFALALWLRMDATQEVHSAFAGNKGLERPEDPGIALAAGKDVRFNAGLAGGGAFDLKPFDIETGAWTFYAVTRSNDGVVRFYQGGQDGNLYWMSENADLSLAAAAPFCVGAAGADDAASRFAGDIDDFALWTRTLSHEDVRRIYEAGLKGVPLADLL